MQNHAQWPLQLPYATPDLPGCGGRLRHSPEDFSVEEIPTYPPSGSGEHIYLWVEKRGISTANLRSKICDVLGLSPRQVGHAGLKDSNAVTRQWMSLHSHIDLPVEKLESERIKIHQVSRHLNKLRPGHLRGNKFEIIVRDTETPRLFPSLVGKLETEGFPNYYGEQRFGTSGDNVVRGRALARSGSRPRMPSDKARFLVNAYQSALFNRLVARRIEEAGSPGMILEGDLAIFHASSSFFPVPRDELENARQRAEAGEISPSAPLFGYKAPLAGGKAGDWERALLEEEGIDPRTLHNARGRNAPAGERKAVRAFAEGLRWSNLNIDGLPCMRFAFTLKPGIYATSFLREIMKNDHIAGFGEELPPGTPGRLQNDV